MPPRVPGTISNGVLSLKFMQRGLAADQKPVEAEKAQLVDDSHWEIAHPPETKALLNTEHQKGFDVTYEASYIPFLYGPETSAYDDGITGPSSASIYSAAVSGRRTFRGGQEVQHTGAAAKEGQEGELRYSSPTASEHSGDEPSKKRTETSSPQVGKQEKSAQTRPLFRKDRVPPPITHGSDSKPQFLRPADVDVPAPRTTDTNPAAGKGKSRRDMLSEMIASAKSSQPATSSFSATTPTNDEAGRESRLRRKFSEEDEEKPPRKKPKRSEGAAIP